MTSRPVPTTSAAHRAQIPSTLAAEVHETRTGIVVLIGTETGKTTLANALAERVGAEVISTDDVRRQVQQEGTVSGSAGTLDSGLYGREKVAALYDAVLARAHHINTSRPLAESVAEAQEMCCLAI